MGRTHGARNRDVAAHFRCTSATVKVRDGWLNGRVIFTLVPFMHVGSDRLNRKAVARLWYHNAHVPCFGGFRNFLRMS